MKARFSLFFAIAEFCFMTWGVIEGLALTSAVGAGFGVAWLAFLVAPNYVDSKGNINAKKVVAIKLSKEV